jgi:translation initiation factor 3 subunit J
LKHAEALFGDLNLVNDRSTNKVVTVSDPNDPTNSVDLSSMAIFNPKTKDQFTKLREALVPLLAANAKKAHYAIFLQEFTKQITKDLPSDQIKKIVSGLTTLSNEKMKEEKAAEKGGKKSKAAKTKVALNANRDISYKADTAIYEGGLEEYVMSSNSQHLRKANIQQR